MIGVATSSQPIRNRTIAPTCRHERQGRSVHMRRPRLPTGYCTTYMYCNFYCALYCTLVPCTVPCTLYHDIATLPCTMYLVPRTMYLVPWCEVQGTWYKVSLQCHSARYMVQYRVQRCSTRRVKSYSTCTRHSTRYCTMHSTRFGQRGQEVWVAHI